MMFGNPDRVVAALIHNVNPLGGACIDVLQVAVAPGQLKNCRTLTFTMTLPIRL